MKDPEDPYLLPESSVLMCPSQEETVLLDGWAEGGPNSDRSYYARKDKRRKYILAYEEYDAAGKTENWVHTSYGINGGNYESKCFYWRWAMPHPWWVGGSRKGTARLHKFKTAPSEVISVYDGWFNHVSGADFFSARHNDATRINVLLCDGSTRSLESSEVSAMSPSSYYDDSEFYDPSLSPGHYFISESDARAMKSRHWPKNW